MSRSVLQPVQEQSIKPLQEQKNECSKSLQFSKQIEGFENNKDLTVGNIGLLKPAKETNLDDYREECNKINEKRVAKITFKPQPVQEQTIESKKEQKTEVSKVQFKQKPSRDFANDSELIDRLIDYLDIEHVAGHSVQSKAKNLDSLSQITNKEEVIEMSQLPVDKQKIEIKNQQRNFANNIELINRLIEYLDFDTIADLGVEDTPKNSNSLPMITSSEEVMEMSQIPVNQQTIKMINQQRDFSNNTELIDRLIQYLDFDPVAYPSVPGSPENLKSLPQIINNEEVFEMSQIPDNKQKTETKCQQRDFKIDIELIDCLINYLDFDPVTISSAPGTLKNTISPSHITNIEEAFEISQMPVDEQNIEKKHKQRNKDNTNQQNLNQLPNAKKDKESADHQTISFKPFQETNLDEHKEEDKDISQLIQEHRIIPQHQEKDETKPQEKLTQPRDFANNTDLINHLMDFFKPALTSDESEILTQTDGLLPMTNVEDESKFAQKQVEEQLIVPQQQQKDETSNVFMTEKQIKNTETIKEPTDHDTSHHDPGKEEHIDHYLEENVPIIYHQKESKQSDTFTEPVNTSLKCFPKPKGLKRSKSEVDKEQQKSNYIRPKSIEPNLSISTSLNTYNSPGTLDPENLQESSVSDTNPSSNNFPGRSSPFMMQQKNKTKTNNQIDQSKEPKDTKKAKVDKISDSENKMKNKNAKKSTLKYSCFPPLCSGSKNAETDNMSTISSRSWQPKPRRNKTSSEDTFSKGSNEIRNDNSRRKDNRSKSDSTSRSNYYAKNDYHAQNDNLGSYSVSRSPIDKYDDISLSKNDSKRPVEYDDSSYVVRRRKKSSEDDSGKRERRRSRRRGSICRRSEDLSKEPSPYKYDEPTPYKYDDEFQDTYYDELSPDKYDGQQSKSYDVSDSVFSSPRTDSVVGSPKTDSVADSAAESPKTLLALAKTMGDAREKENLRGKIERELG